MEFRNGDILVSRKGRRFRVVQYCQQDPDGVPAGLVGCRDTVRLESIEHGTIGNRLWTADALQEYGIRKESA